MDGRIVYIVGAGASHEANLPTGEKLMTEIAKLYNIPYPLELYTSHHNEITILFKEVINNRNERYDRLPLLAGAAKRISNAHYTSLSIDTFMHQHRENKDISICGKIAIVKLILDAERTSRLRLVNREGWQQLNYIEISENSWYNSFFSRLIEGCSSSEELIARFQTITMIVFNYDRCIEHYIYYALQNHYGISNEEAKLIFDNLSIIHPYGTVGSLPWSGETDAIEFGDEYTPTQIATLIKRIATFTEGMDANSDNLKSIHDAIKSANKLIFLGYGFLPINMKLLTPQFIDGKPVKHKPTVYATTYGASKSDTEIIKQSICRLYNNASLTINLADVTCTKFFNEFNLSLRFFN